MNGDIKRKWIPVSFADEACPPIKSRPEEFAVIDQDGRWWLAYGPDDGLSQYDRDGCRELLEPGAVVYFFACDGNPDVRIGVSRDGKILMPPTGIQAGNKDVDGGHDKPGHDKPGHDANPFPAANAVMLAYDPDTLMSSFDEMFAAIREPSHELHNFLIEQIFAGEDPTDDVVFAKLQSAQWSSPLPHLFEVEDGRPVFRPLAAAPG